MRRSTICLPWCCVGVLASAAFASASETTDAAPARPFDPGVLAESSDPIPAAGYRYASLSGVETRALRRSFKLPLDALAGAQTVAKLRQAASVAPLPDPNQPMIAVDPVGGAGASDPFASGPSRTSFRVDPMRALGEMLGASAEDAVAEFEPSSSADDPFAASDGADPFAGGEAVGESGAEAAADDPFSPGEDDPFGGGEDPFGF